LEAEYEKAGEKVIRLEKELQKENDELSDKTKRLKDNRQILVSWKDALRGLEEKEQEQNKLSASYETDKQRLSQRKKDLTANLSDKQEMINRDRKSLDSVEMNIKMRDDRLQRLDSLMIGGDIDENLKQSENDLKRLKHELEDLQQRLKSKGNSHSEQDEIDDIDFLENLNHNHEIEVKKQEITIAHGNKDFLFKLKDRDPAKVREKLLTKYGNLESERDTIRTKLVSMEEEYRAMSLESTDVSDELVALENQQITTKQNYVAIKVEKDELVRKVDGKEKSVNSSIENVATKEAEVNTKRKQLEAYKASIIGREELIAKHKALEALETQLSSIRTELSTYYMNQQSLLADFEKSKHSMVDLNNELQGYEVRVKDRCNSQHKTKKDILQKLEEIGKKLLAVVASEQRTIKDEL
jgi:chromosome segregation ATPase